MKITVVKKDSQHSFSVDAGEKILYAGLRQGLSLPHECATGTCGTCKASLKSGDIGSLWASAPGAKSLKPAKNEFLMCQSFARSDCEIGVRGNIETGAESVYRPGYARGQITGTDMLTADVISLWIKLDRPLRFRSGQFVVVSHADLEGGRAYSMVNCDTGDGEIEFLIKRFPGGGFSEWLFAESRMDAEISLFGPLGIATLGDDEGRDLLCITGGSGIAGIMSLLTQAVNCGYFKRNRGHLFFGVRTYRDLFFHDRLLELCESSDNNLRVSFAFSQGEIPVERSQWPSNVDYLPGDVTPIAMQNLPENLANSIAFLAGPPPMVDDAIRRLVIDKEFPAKDIRYDKFA